MHLGRTTLSKFLIQQLRGSVGQNELAALLPGVANYQVLVEETGDHLLFLHQVRPGGASRSYGIEAARLAGVPPQVVLRARQVLGRIEANSHVAVGLQAAA